VSSDLKGRIQADLNEARKQRDKERTLVLSTILSDLKNRELEAGGTLADEDAVQVIAKAIKQRQDSIEQFKKGARHDLVKREQEQIDLYKKYQPKQLERKDIEEIVAKAIAETGATTKKEMGQVMKVVMPQVKGRADGKLVNQVVSEKLG